jgi:hypothetical protein
MTPLGYYLWIAPHLLLGVVLWALMRRRVHRQFPVFSVYVVTEIIQFLTLFVMAKVKAVSNLQYGVAYTCGLSLSIALRFGIIHELSAHLFRNYGVLRRFLRPFFGWILVTFLLLGLYLAYVRAGHDVSHMISVLSVLERAASMLQCGLLVAMFVFSSYLGLSWRSYVFGIALGLGIFAGVELAASAIRSETGYLYSDALNYLIMATYHCCVLIWAFYLWAPERSSQYAVKVLPQTDLESWNEELQRLLKR